jgi:hypothetical protein
MPSGLFEETIDDMRWKYLSAGYRRRNETHPLATKVEEARTAYLLPLEELKDRLRFENDSKET